MDLLELGAGLTADRPLDRTLFVGKTGLEQAKTLISDYKRGNIKDMTPELWKAKKLVDSTLHPGTDMPPRLSTKRTMLEASWRRAAR